MARNDDFKHDAESCEISSILDTAAREVANERLVSGSIPVLRSKEFSAYIKHGSKVTTEAIEDKSPEEGRNPYPPIFNMRKAIHRRMAKLLNSKDKKDAINDIFKSAYIESKK